MTALADQLGEFAGGGGVAVVEVGGGAEDADVHGRHSTSRVGHPHPPARLRASYSDGPKDACVEGAACPGAVHIRDSKDTAIPALTVTASAWAGFVAFPARQPLANIN
ncbi:DUF397 domain-containing protein [Streptomyces hygroscopicus]|uniref:DUF397 domain-containing protein n=1 Tax=Streptomyces hygroscopicus TaxID=1912 RepID=UPI0033E60DFB